MNPVAPKTSAYTWCLFLGGVCFFSRAVTGLLAGPPPSSGTEILAWIAAAKGAMMLGNEVLVIGAGLLIVGRQGFQQAFERTAPIKTTAGSALLFAACLVCFMLGIVQGRFVYPIHGLSLTRPEDAELLASLYFGGYHLVSLAFAAATTLWALAVLKTPKWQPLGYAGLLAAAGSMVSAYPDSIGPISVFVLEAALALWWIGVSLSLRTTDKKGT